MPEYEYLPVRVPSPCSHDGKRRYGRSAVRPEGFIEDSDKCVAETLRKEGSMIGAQCQNKRGLGPGGLFCVHHARRIGERDRDNLAAHRRTNSLKERVRI